MNQVHQCITELQEKTAFLRGMLETHKEISIQTQAEQKMTGSINIKILSLLENLQTILLIPGQKKKHLYLESNLTQAEIRVAELIRNGKKRGEIGELLCVSEGSVNFHRNNIRKKLGLIRKKVSLRTFLNAME